MAPSSQDENGSWADLINAAKASKATGSAAFSITASVSCTVPNSSDIYMMAMAKPRPPSRFIHRALKQLVMASSVRVYPISRKETTLVISQKKYIHIRFSERTRPNIAARNKNSMERKNPVLSLYSLWCS